MLQSWPSRMYPSPRLRLCVGKEVNHHEDLRSHRRPGSTEQNHRIGALKFAYAAARNRASWASLCRPTKPAAKPPLKQHGKKKEDGELDIDDQGNVLLVDAQAFARA